MNCGFEDALLTGLRMVQFLRLSSIDPIRGGINPERGKIDPEGSEIVMEVGGIDPDGGGGFNPRMSLQNLSWLWPPDATNDQTRARYTARVNKDRSNKEIRQ